jgi:hypothetical protein
MAGQRLLASLCELAWNEVDAAAVARYCRRATRGSVWGDGYAMLTVASRFGTLHLRRRVIAHRDGRPHVMPSNVLLPDHQGLVITRGLQEIACLLPQDVPFASAARLLGWYTGEPGLLSASTLRTLVRDHGDQIRRREQIETVCAVHHRGQRRHLVGVPVEQPRRRPGWPEELSAAVEAALGRQQVCPPAGIRWTDWERVLAARAADAQSPLATLRWLGPEVVPGQMLLVLDEVLTRAPDQGQFHELRTACLLTTETRRYLSGRGAVFLRQVDAAVHACCDRSLLVVADGASWIRSFYRDYLATVPGAEMVLDWYHLAKKCRELARLICPDPAARLLLLRRLFRWLWGGDVARAVGVLARVRPHAADHTAVDDVTGYLEARVEWIPHYRLRRRQRRYLGNGLGEKANDRIVARRQKRKGMQWSIETADALAALRTLLLNGGWEDYWQKRQGLSLDAA